MRRWIKRLYLFDDILNDPFKLVPFAFDIFRQFQLTAGANKIMFGVGATEISVSRDIVIEKSCGKLDGDRKRRSYKIAYLSA